jgi:hypothetical protein
MRHSPISLRRLAMGASACGEKPSVERAWRLISALPSRQRQIRSGFSPMME